MKQSLSVAALGVMMGSLLSGCLLMTGSGGRPAPNHENQPPPGPPSEHGSRMEPAPAHDPAPAAPSVVSVSIRNSCRETVKVFYGDKPKFGSGTRSSLGGNSISSKQMKPGEMIWLIDDQENGLGAVTISEATRNVEVLDNCSGIVAR